MMMNRCIAELPSYTLASKAERLLRARGIRCRLRRRENTAEGCGWDLEIASDRRSACRNAFAVLDRYDIPYRVGGDSP
ncbi:MAG: hypothetical protein IJ874_09570 [Ruminococcus sp.]|nr:hypothetical protein [Ruminococcus sp.]